MINNTLAIAKLKQTAEAGGGSNITPQRPLNAMSAKSMNRTRLLRFKNPATNMARKLLKQSAQSRFQSLHMLDRRTTRKTNGFKGPNEKSRVRPYSIYPVIKRP